MNVQAVLLHVLGDALGSVGVIISALVIMFGGDDPRRVYIDPVVSLVIVIIILVGTIPVRYCLHHEAHLIACRGPGAITIPCISPPPRTELALTACPACCFVVRSGCDSALIVSATAGCVYRYLRSDGLVASIVKLFKRTIKLLLHSAPRGFNVRKLTRKVIKLDGALFGVRGSSKC